MKIAHCEAFMVDLPLSRPYTIAYKTIKDTQLVFLDIALEDGRRGLGSANPFVDVVGETPQKTLENLQSGFLETWKGRDIRQFNLLIQEAAQAFPHFPGTLAAIDLALHDLFGKYLGLSVLEFYGQRQHPLATSVTIGIKETQEMIRDAEEYIRMGFRILKIKTGKNLEEDIERVRSLHSRFGSRVMLRVDANQGYNRSQLQAFLQQTAGCGVELIEQPLPVGSESELRGLPENVQRMLVADESLLDAQSAWRWSTPPQFFGVYNIKLMKSGGIRGALDIARIAEQAGIQLFWGCNDESRVSITAALHAAYACGNTRYLDLDGSFDLSRDLVDGGFRLQDGILYPEPGTGLGVHRIL